MLIDSRSNLNSDIHGAIITKECGFAWVTGVQDVTSLIETGDPLTGYGYLGIAVIA